MKRIAVISCALACALGAPGAALAATVWGTISQVGVSSFTVQTPGRPVGVIAALSTAANRVTKSDYPYVWGGGHAQAGVASVGIKGPGHNGKRVGYDCSGSVAAVLAGAGLWPAGAGVPNDAGVIALLLQQHVIARGAGTGPVEVTLYDHPGVHIFMNIDGRFFGTSDGGGGSNPRGGAGWLDDGAPDSTARAYKRYHVLPSLLAASTNAGHSVTFDLSGLDASEALLSGAKVQVDYEQTPAGTLAAAAVTYPGSQSATGTVTAIAPDGSSLTIQLADGSSLTFATAAVTQLLGGVNLGDAVQVTYLASGSALTPVSLTDTGAPSSGAPSTGTPTPGGPSSGTPAAGQSSGY